MKTETDLGAEAIIKAQTRMVETRQCERCHFENRPDAVYCGHCGAHLVGKPCPACHALNSDDLQYCDNCGTWLDKPAQRRPLYAAYPVGFVNPRFALLALCAVVFICAFALFGLAAAYPGLLSSALNVIGAGLAAVGLLLALLYFAAFRALYSR